MPSKRWGFTLIEVLIVVAILAILAASAVPQFEDSAVDARDATLMQTLRILRQQIEHYKAQHKGRPPGWPNQIGFVYPQLLSYSNSAGATSNNKTSEYQYGPYLNTTPKNPINNGMAFKDSTDPTAEAPDETMQYMGNTVGWFYNTANGVVAPNAEGTTSVGTPRIQL